MNINSQMISKWISNLVVGLIFLGLSTLFTSCFKAYKVEGISAFIPFIGLLIFIAILFFVLGAFGKLPNTMQNLFNRHFGDFKTSNFRFDKAVFLSELNEKVKFESANEKIANAMETGLLREGNRQFFAKIGVKSKTELGQEHIVNTIANHSFSGVKYVIDCSNPDLNEIKSEITDALIKAQANDECVIYLKHFEKVDADEKIRFDLKKYINHPDFSNDFRKTVIVLEYADNINDVIFTSLDIGVELEDKLNAIASVINGHINKIANEFGIIVNSISGDLVGELAYIYESDKKFFTKKMKAIKNLMIDAKRNNFLSVEIDNVNDEIVYKTVELSVSELKREKQKLDNSMKPTINLVNL